jgi:hypothetical protein
MSITCDTCGLEQRNTQQKSLPDGGWSLDIDNFGYYGGFDDNIEVSLSGKPTRYVSMCHDCVVKLLTTFPLLGQKLEGGHHPNFMHTDFRDEGDNGTLHPSCCRWAWCWNKIGERKYETYFGDGNGGWILAHTDED